MVFFAEADIGDGFYAPFDRTSRNKLKLQNDHKKLLFAKYVTLLMPDLIESNPERFGHIYKTDTEKLASQNYSTDVHYDSDQPGTVTYITIGMNADGEESSTLFTKNKELYGRRYGELSTLTQYDNFRSAPDGYASIFDPDEQLHCADPVNIDAGEYRVLYRASIRHDHGPQLILPDKPGFIVPVF